jgi:2-polyprenyl-3-methyl-5-hydroxy-6-metoxy-1,4-benzoquinol methylase
VIERWSEGVADHSMAEEILLELGDQIRAHPWWRARAALTLELLSRLAIRPPARVLDAGCGWGVTLDALEERGYEAAGLDVSRRTLEHLDRPGRRLIEADLTQPLPENAVKEAETQGALAVLALDVLEHLDDDRATVRRLGRLVSPGGVVIVSVPALPELFSEFDAIQGHRRRYLPETLRTAFDDTGLHLERVFWWGRWLVSSVRRQRSRPLARPGESPAQVYRRYLSLPPWPVPWSARLAFLLEQAPALRGSLKTGTSLFAVARRPGA